MDQDVKKSREKLDFCRKIRYNMTIEVKKTPINEVFSLWSRFL